MAHRIESFICWVFSLLKSAPLTAFPMVHTEINTIFAEPKDVIKYISENSIYLSYEWIESKLIEYTDYTLEFDSECVLSTMLESVTCVKSNSSMERHFFTSQCTLSGTAQSSYLGWILLICIILVYIYNFYSSQRQIMRKHDCLHIILHLKAKNRSNMISITRE